MPAPNVDEVQVPCSLFLGLNTEVTPVDLPEGISPDCQDVAFVPGSVSSRPCLKSVFPGNAFPGNPTVAYEKTFVRPNNDPLNLYMTSDGSFWFQDILADANSYTLIDQLIAALYAQSCTAAGAEYIAFSDGLHGADIPRQVYIGPDGNLFFDRVSQDGPGAGPTVTNYIPASATIASPGAGSGITIVASPNGIVWGGFITVTDNSIPNRPPTIQHFYTLFTVTTATPHGLVVGQLTTLAGTTATPAVNQLWTVNTVISATQFTILQSVASGSQVNGGGGTSSSSDYALQRTSNVVNVATSTAHGFQVGWQVQISGVANKNIGGGITGITRDTNGVVTVTTSGAHGLPANASIAITGVSDTSFNGTFGVASVPSPTTFTYALGGAVASSSGGNVQDIWNTTQFIQSIPTPTTFTYNQLGANDVTTAGGTATIIGQISPGTHQCVVMFQTRSGYVTAPSPPISFDANGTQQIQISNIPTGPSNVIARILAFTGTGGENYFYLPVTPQVGTQVVGTSTVINDNTSTGAIIDFSDTTLFGGLAIDVTGNNLFAQVVLGPCLGFFYYASRLLAWGMSAKINNVLNMGFEGGFAPSPTIGSFPVQPLGWTANSTSIGFTVIYPGFGIAGGAWADGMAYEFDSITDISGNATTPALSQPGYQDINGVAILQPDTLYNIRFWAQASTAGLGGNFVIEFYSPTSGSLCKAVVPVINLPSLTFSNGGFVTVQMSSPTPLVIPSDTVIRLYCAVATNGGTFLTDEFEIIPAESPYVQGFMVSYVDNFEAFDGVTGLLGPTSDPNPVMGCETLRDQLQFLTSGGMHQTSDNGQEPSSWTVSEISNDVGLAAYRAIDAGEECIVFVSKSGGGNGSDPTYALRIYEGGQPWKISQEVQTIFDNINQAAESTMWLVNDIGQRRIYIGVPTDNAGAPNMIYVLDYREIDTAGQIASAASIHISFTGKMIASDLARKWTKWNIQANCGAMLSTAGTNVQFCLGAGNGEGLGQSPGFGQIYILDPTRFTDDDYGVMSPYYVMYFFISRDNETALGVGSMRKLYKRISEFMSAIGNITITPYATSLTNPWPGPPTFQPGLNPTEDNYHGINVSTERMAVKYAVTPLDGETDVQFTLQHMECTVMQHPMSPFGTGANL